MWNLWNRFRADRRGGVVVEFAMFVPFLLLLLAGTVEVGRAYFLANAVDKGLRAGALYASRADDPASSSVKTIVENIVKTGTMDGSGPYLVPGWASPTASLAVQITDYAVGLDTVPHVRLEAEVPWAPVMPSLMSFVGLGTHVIKAHHEQLYVGS